MARWPGGGRPQRAAEQEKDRVPRLVEGAGHEPKVARPGGTAREAGVPRESIPRVGGRSSPCLEKLDRLGWTAGLAFRAYGARIGIRVTDSDALTSVRSLLPTGAVPSDDPAVDHLVSFVVGGVLPVSGVRRFHLLYAGAKRLIRTFEGNEVLGALEHHLELAVAETARRRLFIHAGVVGWRGRAILLPGPSHSGKSRLVASLLEAGADYLSDEYAVLDERGRVHPYPRPLVLREKGGTRRIPPAELGAATARAPLPVGLVAVTWYERGARWRPEARSPGRAILDLLTHTVLVRKSPERVLATLACVTPDASTLVGVRGESDDAARLLLEAAPWRAP